MPVALAGQPRALRFAEQPLARFVELRLIAHEEADLTVRVAQLADRDVVARAVLAAHRGAPGLFHVGKMGLPEVGKIGLEQKMAAAGKLEAPHRSEKRREGKGDGSKG